MTIQPQQPLLPPGPHAGLAARIAALSKKSEDDPQARAELRRACQEVEAYFLTTLLREMRRTVPQAGLFPHGPTEETSEYLLDDALAKAISRGQGFGVARALEAQLHRAQSPDAPAPAAPRATPGTRSGAEST